MLSLGFAGGSPLRRLLAIGAHSDDLEIGCSGTVLALLNANPDLSVDWVVLAADGDRGRRPAGVPKRSWRARGSDRSRCTRSETATFRMPRPR